MNNINYVSLGEKIKTIRKERGYTQEKLAEICEFPPDFSGISNAVQESCH